MRGCARAVTGALVLVLAGCGGGGDADEARAAASRAAEDRAVVEALASEAARDRAAAEAKLRKAKAAGRTPTPTPSAPAPSTPAARPAAVGSGSPECNGPCRVDRRLTRSFLSQYSGEQTLLLARASEPDERGNLLHAFLVDAQNRVLWEEHGFGFQWMPVDERFGIRFDEAGHTFFRSFVADFTYIYVLDTSTGTPRLVGAPDGSPMDGFQLGEVLERPGRAAFDVQETLVECPDGGDPNVLDCPTREVVYRWNGTRYV